MTAVLLPASPTAANILHSLPICAVLVTRAHILRCALPRMFYPILFRKTLFISFSPFFPSIQNRVCFGYHSRMIRENVIRSCSAGLTVQTRQFCTGETPFRASSALVQRRKQLLDSTDSSVLACLTICRQIFWRLPNNHKIEKRQACKMSSQKVWSVLRVS